MVRLDHLTIKVSDSVVSRDWYVTNCGLRVASRGVPFVHGPKLVAWGYGAELRDPDGYRVLVWDAKTMPGYRAK